MGDSLTALPDSDSIPRRLRALQEHFIGGNRVTLFSSGDVAFAAMLDAIRGAQKQILLEMYWFDSGRIGRRFAEVLCERAKAGVKVAVMYDAVGSWAMERDSMHAAMEASGIKVVEYNPVAPWRQRFRLARFNWRNHRKVLMVDGQVGFTGGANIADQWLSLEQGGSGWRDAMVKVEGPCVADLVRAFYRTWKSQEGSTLASLEGSAPARVADQSVLILEENSLRKRWKITSAYLLNIWRARKRVWIANSYFIPDRRIVRALIAAAKRGVDVRVMLPFDSDVAVAAYASRAMYDRLLRHGVRIFEWFGPMLHLKTAVIDGCWSTVGTFNLDHRSWRFSLEVNVAVRDEGFGQAMEQAYIKDLEHCAEVDLLEFRYRPLGSRFVEWLCYRFRHFL